jgi:stage II sporulation protein D
VARVSSLLAVLLVLVWGYPGRADVPVRVRLLARAESVRLSGDGLRVDGHPVASGEIVVAAVSGSELRWGQRIHRGPLPAEARGDLQIQGRSVPGTLRLVPTPEGRLDVVNVVPLEPYVERVVSGEIYASWPMEALKAQAVVARTYALYERERKRGLAFDVEASVLSQRYATGSVPERVMEAVRSTRSQYLTFAGGPILAAFHTAAGGQTAASEEVWGEALPYLKGVESPDEESPEYFWSYEIEEDELLAALERAGLQPAAEGGVSVVERSPSGRVSRVEIGGLQVSGRTLRQILGRHSLRSTLFDVRTDGSRVRFLGSGAGHGVGLSQWGAWKMANEGKGYGEILTHYFPGAEVRTMTGTPPEDGTR